MLSDFFRIVQHNLKVRREKIYLYLGNNQVEFFSQETINSYSSLLTNFIKLRIQFMKPKKLIFLLVTLAFYFLATANANAGDIDVKAGNVRVRTEQNGNISVDTGRNEIEVNQYRRNSSPWWRSWYYWNRPQHTRNCNNSTYQRSTQTTRVNGRATTHSTSTSTCR